MMDKYVVFLVISLFLSPNADGRSWYRYDPRDRSDDRIVFEDYRDRRWHGNDFGEVGHSDGRHGSGYKHQWDWNPGRVWFPDSGEEDHSIPTRYTTGLPRQVATTSSPLNINECVKQCPTTSEYNPVCGSNKITYSNIGHLECARLCGLDVSLYRNFPCSFITETTTAPVTLTESNFQRRCIETCPTTPEYNPICGTNNVTYQNMGKLECAKLCGVDVELKRLSPCPKPITTASPIGDDPFNSRGQPPWTSNTDGSVFRQTTRAPDRPNLTISQDILNSIFNIPTEDSNDFDIDIRSRE